jgi:hypothetical protein
MSDSDSYLDARCQDVENIIAVRMKSIASTASEENTTVRVVA